MNPRGLGSWALLLAVGGIFGAVTGLPFGSGVLIAVVGGLGSGLLDRWPRRADVRSLAPVPVVVAFATVAALAPLGLLPELLAGAAGVAVLVWLADDIRRPAGGIRRSQLTLGVPALALGIAWASALLLPSTAASLGVAVALLVFVVAAIAYLIGAPRVFDREEPSVS